ncbi:MAG: pyridoxal phosphate-dependent aminotransferase [Verrucomicrobiota bacterium]
MDLSSRIKNITPSQTLAVTAAAKRMKDEGQEVFGFGAGEPDLDTPHHIKEAAIDALNEGETKYTPAAGIPELRKAIAHKLQTENGLNYQDSQVVVNCGAKHSVYNAILATCEAGDEVIIPAPYWTSYPEMVRMVGAEPVIVETKQENGWKLTPEDFENAMSPLTKMIIVNSPGNPTGAVYTKEELAALGEVASYEDIIILSDEIYEKLVYGEAEHVSIGSISKELHDLTITVNGFSKAYSMTGWRLGYTAAPEEIAAAITNIQSHSTSNPTSFAQYGAVAAIMGEQQVVADMRDEYDMRRQYMLNRFQQMKNVSTVEPQGAFYFLVSIEKMGIKSVNFAEKLLARTGVAVVPGSAFGSDYTVRFSYATSLDVINEGLNRFEEFCKAH